MQPINEAISIMFVGMLTVFFILFLIVVIGNTIVRLSNKYLPEEVVPLKATKSNSPSNNTLAAISTAIEIATGGKGKVTNIKKL